MPCRFNEFTIKASRFLSLVCFLHLALAHSFALSLFHFSLYFALLSFLKPCTVNGVSSILLFISGHANTEVVEHPSATLAHPFSSFLPSLFIL